MSAHDTEALAEVRLTDAEREALRRELDTRGGSPRHRQMITFTERILAARIVQARAGEGALRERIEAALSKYPCTCRTDRVPMFVDEDCPAHRNLAGKVVNDLRAALAATPGDQS